MIVISKRSKDNEKSVYIIAVLLIALCIFAGCSQQGSSNNQDERVNFALAALDLTWCIRIYTGGRMNLENSICKIEICVDQTYTLESVDNKVYDLIINPSNLKRSDVYKVFYIHIDLFYKTISIALIGGLYSYDTECAVIENDVLTVLQNDAIVQINVNDGSLLSYNKIDSFGCNFAIYKIKTGYIIYGEIEISMLDFEFNKKWTFSGRDIFVSISGKKSFVLCENSIQLYDFEDNFYEINFEGQLVSDK